MIPGTAASTASDRGHRLLAAPSDSGRALTGAVDAAILEVYGADAVMLLEELGLALAELTADVDALALLERGSDALPRLEAVRLEAGDPSALAAAWITELLRRVEVDGALVAIEVETVSVTGEEARAGAASGPGDSGSRTPRWALRARVATLPFGGDHVRRTGVGPFTSAAPEVAPGPGGWRMTVHLTR